MMQVIFNILYIILLMRNPEFFKPARAKFSGRFGNRRKAQSREEDVAQQKTIGVGNCGIIPPNNSLISDQITYLIILLRSTSIFEAKDCRDFVSFPRLTFLNRQLTLHITDKKKVTFNQFLSLLVLKQETKESLFSLEAKLGNHCKY